MATACASNFNSLLPRHLLVRNKTLVIYNVSLPSAVNNTAFPVLQAVTVNRKHRFVAMPQSHAVGIGDTSRGSAGDDLVLFGQNLDFEQVVKETEARGASLPPELLIAAKDTGIPELCLYRYLCMQDEDEYGLAVGFVMKSWSMFRNQMMIDPMYLIQLAKKFGFSMFVDVTIATWMNVIGIDHKVIVIFFWIRFFDKVVTEGLIASQKYAKRITRQLEGYSDYSMFLAERAVSLGKGAIAFGRIYCGAALIFALCMTRSLEFSPFA